MSYFKQPEGVVSTLNTSIALLPSGSTFTGTAELNTHPDVMVSCHTDKAGTLYFDFSNNGTDWNTFPTAGFAVSANIHEFHTAVKGARYFRVRLVNDTADTQGFLRLYTYFGVFRHGNLPLNQSVGADADATIVRSVLLGATDGGNYVNVPVTGEGHVEVAVHEPRTPFGALHTEQYSPVFQTDAVYGINTGQVATGVTLSGTMTTSESMFVCSTGVTQYAQAFLQSNRRLRYRPGQGVVGRFTAMFTTPVSQSYQVVGFGHSEDGIYIATSGSSFGILYSSFGVREQQLLTITTPSSTSQSVVVVLNNVSASVPVSNSGNSLVTTYQLTQGTYSGWKAEPTGSAVLFTRDAVGKTTGAFSVSGSTIAGTFSVLQSGSATTEIFVSQSDWNGDKLDGTGYSGVTLNPYVGNVYEMSIQYLGFGPVVIKAEVNPAGNNPTFVSLHTFDFPNTRTRPSFGNPSFPFSLATYSAGSTTNLTTRVASFAGFTEGLKELRGNRFSYRNSVTSVSTTVYTPVFTIMNSRRFGNRTNQSVINLLSVAFGARLSTQAYGELFLIRNGVLSGPSNFSRITNRSCALFDTGSTAVVFTGELDVIFSMPIVESLQGVFPFTDEISLQPGDTLTIAAKLANGTATFMSAVLNTKEDQ